MRQVSGTLDGEQHIYIENELIFKCNSLKEAIEYIREEMDDMDDISSTIFTGKNGFKN